jgi:diguanylate cyclase (GGDEF)-like protein
MQTVLHGMLTQWGYDVVVTADGAAAWDVLRRPARPDLAIVDWMMPRLKGPELCRRLRAETPDPYTYVLMLTSRTKAGDIVEGFNSGVDDYLAKPFHAQELWARIRTGTRTIGIQRELADAREALRVSAVTDQLTGLAHRSAILTALDRALERAERDSRPLSILAVKIDRFRQINDSFGREAGDAVLRQCAARLVAACLDGQVVGRYGGRKFLVLLPDTDSVQAAAAAGRVRAAVSADVVQAGAASFPVACSVGVATHGPGAFSEAGRLLRAAEEPAPA